MGDLALELGMTISEMERRMSAHELTVFWPTYFATKARITKRQQKRQGG